MKLSTFGAAPLHWANLLLLLALAFPAIANAEGGVLLGNTPSAIKGLAAALQFQALAGAPASRSPLGSGIRPGAQSLHLKQPQMQVLPSTGPARRVPRSLPCPIAVGGGRLIAR